MENQELIENEFTSVSKSSLIDLIWKDLESKDIEITKVMVTRVVNSAISIIADQLKQGNKVVISKFISFGKRLVKGRMYNNPQNPGKQVLKPDTFRGVAKFSKIFNQNLNGKDSRKKKGNRKGRKSANKSS